MEGGPLSDVLTPSRAAPRSSVVRAVGGMLAAVVLAALWAMFIGTLTDHLRLMVAAGGVLAAVFSVLFVRWRLFRLIPVVAFLPATFLAFEVAQKRLHASADVHDYLTWDRAHYLPNMTVRRPAPIDTAPGRRDRNLPAIRIGMDGYRADLETGVGNPPRCDIAIVGDSLIFGSGLPYEATLGPLLRARGLDNTCVFGVGGNAPFNYLATLRHVQERLEPGAHVTVYLAARNDFIWSPHVLAKGRIWWLVSDAILSFDTWRKSTRTYGSLHGEGVRAAAAHHTWKLAVGGAAPVDLSFDPAAYAPPPPLATRTRRYMQVFFDNLREHAASRGWRVDVVVAPDGEEIAASLAIADSLPPSRDPARREVLEMCRAARLSCRDLVPFLHERSLAARVFPYFTDDPQHLSAFGTRVIVDEWLQAAGTK